MWGRKPGDNRRYYSDIRSGFSIFGDHYSHCRFYQNFADLEIVKNAFAGIRICVCVLILNAVIKLLKSSVVDKATLVIYAAVAVGSILTSVSPIIFVLLAGIAGVLLQNWKGGATK